MPTNVFFNNFASSGEQNLIEDLIIESVRIYGMDMWYIPRDINNYDLVYNEDAASSYDAAVLIEMFIRNVNAFQGDGDFLSKFGLQIRDSMTFTIARRTFNLEVAASYNLPRPREGDLIYFPLNKKVFVIKFVEHEAIFYQLGSLQTFDLQCDLWEYSNEKFNTGIAEIDALEQKFSFAMDNSSIEDTGGFTILDTDGFSIIQAEFDFTDQVNADGSHMSSNQDLQNQNDGIINFNETNPFGEIK